MFNANRSCSAVPDAAASDPGIAGAGVLLSFIITAALAVSLSVSIIIQKSFHGRSSGPSFSKIARKMLNSLSDQQIVTGIGIQSLALAKLDTIIPMHFFMVWMLGLLSNATHLATLLALVNDFKRDWVLRWLRQFLMFVNMILSSVLGILILQVVMKDAPQTLPMRCAWNSPSHGAVSNAGISIAGTIAVIALNFILLALATWYLHSRMSWIKTVQFIGLVLLAAMAVGAAARVLMLSQAFGNPSLQLKDTAEKDWSYGQLLPLLLLILPLISALEIMRGMHCVTQFHLSSTNGKQVRSRSQHLSPTINSHLSTSTSAHLSNQTLSGALNNEMYL